MSQKYFEVVVSGQYIALSNATGTHSLKNYVESFIVPSQEAALSKICKHLLSPKLKQKYPDFIRYRTHQKVKTTLFNYTPDAAVLQMSIEDMNLTELHDFCILRQLEIDPFVHGKKDIFSIRAMVLKANDDKRQYAKDKRDSKNASEETEAEKLRQMNQLPTENGTEININEQLVKKPQGQNQPVITPRPPADAMEFNNAPAPATTTEQFESSEPLPPIEPEEGDDPFAL